MYCIDDYWDCRAIHEETLSFRDVAVKTGSVGQIFKLPEAEIRERLLTIQQDSDGYFSFRESAASSQLIRKGNREGFPLSAVYHTEPAHA
jgi:hypothetical protein